MKKKIKSILLCFMIGEILTACFLSLYISFSILFMGSYYFYEKILIILIGEIIGISIGIILFIYFLVEGVKNELFNL